MTEPLVVIVSGPPGAGKTTLARELAPALGLPLLTKDDIKESLFGSLGWSDRAWSKRIGAATWELLFLLAEQMVRGGASFVIESNFERNRHAERFRELRERSPFVVVEVHLHAEVRVLARRFREREASGERHPGHGDPSLPFLRDFAAALAARNHVPLGLSEHLVRIDTGEAPRIDVAGIARRIRRIGGP